MSYDPDLVPTAPTHATPARRQTSTWTPRWLPRPTTEHPNRYMLTSPYGHIILQSLAEARMFVDHPGSIGPMARHYIACGGTPPAGREGAA